jgi:hypothetical protein
VCSKCIHCQEDKAARYKKLIDKIYTHNLSNLIGVVGIKIEGEVKVNWTLVKDWSEQVRYKRHTEEEAKDIYHAVANPKEGVLEWIKQHW